MNTKIKQIFKISFFIVIFMCTFNFILILFTPTWFESLWDPSKTAHGFYDLENDSLDVLVIGSSAAAASFDPFELYEQTGLISYNLGFMQQPMMGTYYWLKEALKTQAPQLIMLEVKTAGRVSDKNEVDARKSYDYMNWNFNKLHYAYDVCTDNDENQLFEYLFPLSLYHTRWSELSKDDYDFIFGDCNSATRGFAPLNYTTTLEVLNSGIDTSQNKTSNKYNKINAKFLKEIIKLCKDRNIQLILYKSPDSRWTVKKYNHVKEIADNLGARYIDLNDLSIVSNMDFNYYEDMADTIHVNVKGSKKVTTYLANVLKTDYSLTSSGIYDKSALDKANSIIEEAESAVNVSP